VTVTDRTTRTAERLAAAGDPAARARYLVARLRTGTVSREQVALAARLGAPVAREVLPGEPLVDWADYTARKAAIAETQAIVGRPSVVRCAADWAERVLPAWERDRAGDGRPRVAIAAARAWADCPCEGHEAAAKAAADAASDASASAYAADAAYYASASAYAAAASASAYAYAACAAYAAYAACAAAAAAYASATTAYAAYAAYVAADSDSEREWQRLRLAAYVLGEVE